MTYSEKKALISFAVVAKLIFRSVFANAKKKFSQNEAHIMLIKIEYYNFHLSSNMPMQYTVKALINARAFIRIVTFHREGVGIYKRLECSQSIFEKQKHSVCFITSVLCLAIV